MKMLFSVLLLSATMLPACQNATKDAANSPSKATTKEDSLYKAVIALHDEAMPKIGKIKGYQKTLQAKIDSLNTVLQDQKNEAAKKLKSNYEVLLAQLNAAEKSMNDWMDSFNPEPKLPSKAEIDKYWEHQKMKAQKMKDDIINAIDSSKARIKE